MSIVSLAHTLVVGSLFSDIATTSEIDTSGASLLVAFVGSYAGDCVSGTFSDSKSNSWSHLTAQAGSSRHGVIYYSVPSSVGLHHTFSYTEASSVQIALAVASFSGTAASSPFDQQNGAIGASGTSMNTGSVTPTEDNELLYTGIYVVNGGPSSVSTGFSTLDTDNATGAGHGILIQTTAAAKDPSWSWSASDAPAACIATFKAASALHINRLTLLGVS